MQPSRFTTTKIDGGRYLPPTKLTSIHIDGNQYLRLPTFALVYIDAHLGRSAVVAVRTGEPGEVALAAVLLGLLVDEGQVPLVEGVEPVLPRHVPQLVAAVTGEVEPQHAEVVAVFGARHRGRFGVPLLGPPTDRVVVVRGQGLAAHRRPPVVSLVRTGIRTCPTHPGTSTRKVAAV